MFVTGRRKKKALEVMTKNREENTESRESVDDFSSALCSERDVILRYVTLNVLKIDSLPHFSMKNFWCEERRRKSITFCLSEGDMREGNIIIEVKLARKFSGFPLRNVHEDALDVEQQMNRSTHTTTTLDDGFFDFRDALLVNFHSYYHKKIIFFALFPAKVMILTNLN
jgi:hypothetical protein